MVNDRFRGLPTRKLCVDPEDLWTDVVAAYKGSLDFHGQIRVLLHGSPTPEVSGDKSLQEYLKHLQTMKFFVFFKAPTIT